jgi:hypothetical protein
MGPMPALSRVFGSSLAVLVVNLLWNEPLRVLSGGGAVAFLALNVLPSAAAIAWAVLGGRLARR